VDVAEFAAADAELASAEAVRRHGDAIPRPQFSFDDTGGAGLRSHVTLHTW